MKNKYKKQKKYNLPKASLGEQMKEGFGNPMSMGFDVGGAALSSIASNLGPNENISKGGQIASNVIGDTVGAVPIVGGLAKGLVSMGTKIADLFKGRNKDPRKDLEFNSTHTNASAMDFGMAKYGMNLDSNKNEFIDYTGKPSHEQGGLNVNEHGIPDMNNPKVEVEGKENTSGDFVFSDSLKTEKGITYAKQNKKYYDMSKKRNNNEISKLTADKLSKRLADKNQAHKEQVELASMLENEVIPTLKKGGYLPKANTGLKLTADEMTDMYNQENFLNKKLTTSTEPIKREWDLQSNLERMSADVNYKNIPNQNVKAKRDFDFNMDKDKLKTAATYLPHIGATIGHAVQAFRKPDKETPRLNKHSDEIIAKMKGRENIDINPLLNELKLSTNSAMENLSNNTTSTGVMNANAQKLYANEIGEISKVMMNKQQVENQAKAETANVMNSLGMQEAQALTTADDLNARNKGVAMTNRNSLVAQTLPSFSKHMGELNKTNKQNTEMMNLLNNTGNLVKVNKKGIITVDEEGIKQGKYKPEEIQASYDYLIKNHNEEYIKKNHPTIYERAKK